MDFRFTPEDEEFRAEARQWLAERLDGPGGPFAHLRGRGGPGGEPLPAAARRAWERELGRGGWIGLGWHGSHGNRRATLAQQVVFNEEYARAGAPTRAGHIGEHLFAPTLLAFGTPEQQKRFLPPVARGEELWCQGYSEPGAGSDLAALRTRAVRDGTGYRVTGRKIWTSLAHEADWCFLLARTDPASRRHRGLSFLLLRMDRPGVEVRPIRQLTGGADFNEVSFDGARAEHLVGEEGGGWRVAMGLLAFERGVATLGQQIGFARELDAVLDAARRTGAADDPVIRERITALWAELRVLRWNALRTLGSPVPDPGAASVAKLLWSGWHQRLGDLAMDVQGPAAATGRALPYDLDPLQHLYLFSRADTIYGGSNEIQRNVLAQRVLGLPREPHP